MFVLQIFSNKKGNSLEFPFQAKAALIYFTESTTALKASG